jgi:transposase-like protein
MINRLDEGDSIKVICNEYGVSRSTLYRWMHDGKESTSDPENVQVHSAKDWNILQRRMEKLENIIVILKTVNCTIHAPLKEKLSELELLYGQYDVHTLCEALRFRGVHSTTISSATNEETLGLRNAGRSTVY